MVSVGYMDPGNWATDLAAGSRYNYRLIWVLLMSNLMAVLLQSLAARLGIVSRTDLAQANREEYPSVVNIPLYVLAEIAITATDLAEVIGSAIALNLLFGLPLLYGVLLTALDVLLLLILSHYGIRRLEAVITSLVGTIAVAFLIEIFLARPEWGGVLRGFTPSLPDATALYIAIGILGATVMPHNLYLHSSLVQTRKIGRTPREIWQAIRLNTFDSAIALNAAFFVNSAILIVAAAVFYRTGHNEVAEIQDAHRLLEPLLGTALAPIAFAVALLASGQSSTITGTLAGQIVMEGYLHWRIRPWLRRLLTRLLAIAPAVFAILHFGEQSTGELLVLSQVVLSLQLPFATIPLIHFVADRRRMGEFAISRRLQAAAWVVAGLIVALNMKLVVDEIQGWLTRAGDRAWLLYASVVPLSLALLLLLAYITVRPWLDSRLGRAGQPRGTDLHPLPARPAPQLALPPAYHRIAIALDFGEGQERLLNEALRFARFNHPHYYLLHVTESPAAQGLRDNAADREIQRDRERLAALAEMLQARGLTVTCHVGTGDPAGELARLVNEVGADLLIVGSHGHRGVADVLYGTTIDRLRHLVRAHVLIVSRE
ncbi:MAG: divalent metal cation transporter MntH [Litorilinea sp.]|nr:MAG: divalent metal cation transporter MntH [Litorilinea sp.]